MTLEPKTRSQDQIHGFHDTTKQGDDLLRAFEEGTVVPLEKSYQPELRRRAREIVRRAGTAFKQESQASNEDSRPV